jgi:hypothetical protein
MSLRRSRSIAIAVAVVASMVAFGFTGPAKGASWPYAPFVEVDSLVVGGEPKDLVLHPDGDLLFVSDFSRNLISVVDLDSRLVVRRLFAPGGPAGMAISADGRYLFVASFLGDKLFRYELETGFRAIVPNLAGPWAVEFVTTPGQPPFVAVTQQYADRVSFVDAETLRVVASVATSHYPYQMSQDVEGQVLYIAAHGGPGGGRLDAIDMRTLSPKWRAATARGSFDVEYDRGSGTVLVTNYSGRSLTRVSKEGVFLGTSVLPGEPREVVSAQGYSFVAVQPAAQVLVLDGRGEKVYSTPVGGRPSGVLWLTQPKKQLGVLAVANEADGTVSLLAQGEPRVRFLDVPSSHLYARYIGALQLRGSLHGYRVDGGFAFRPEAAVLRAQVAKIVVEALSLAPRLSYPAGQAFLDVPPGSEYPFYYVQRAAEVGIARGVSVSPPLFEPYGPVTRIQLLRMLLRGADAVGSPFTASSGPVPFDDVQAGDPDYAVIATGYAAGLISGRPREHGGLAFDKYALATRGHLSKMVFEMLARLHEVEPNGE